MFRKKLGAAGHRVGFKAPMAQSHPGWLQNIDYGSKHFLRKGEEMNLVAVVTLALAATFPWK